jgi:hypothetical protein
MSKPYLRASGVVNESIGVELARSSTASNTRIQ